MFQIKAHIVEKNYFMRYYNVRSDNCSERTNCRTITKINAIIY